MPNAQDLAADGALRARTLAGCANSARDRHVLGEAAHALMAAGRHQEALEVFDVIIGFTDLPLLNYCNALWVAQADNTRLPIDAARDRRYLAACLPHGRSNPPIFLNAAGVCVELGEREQAIANLLRAAEGKVDLRPYLNEPLFRELTTHPTWAAIAAGTPPPATPVSLLGLAVGAISRGDFADAVPALRQAWRVSRSPRIADLLDRLSELDGRRVGYGASWIEAALQTSSSEIPALVRNTVRSLRDGRGGYGDKHTPGGLWLMGECDDPRYATALLRILAAPPLVKVRRKVEDGWAVALTMLVALGDRRAIEPLAAMAMRYPALMPTPMGGWLAKRIAETAEALRGQEPPAPLDAGDAACCAAIEVALAALPPAATAARPAATASQAAISAPAAALPAPSASLLAAIAAFDRGDLAGASEGVLAAWRRTRAPRLAEVLDLLDARAGTAAADAAELSQEAWLELAFLNRPADEPVLLRSLHAEIDYAGSIPNAQDPAERIWALTRRDDPRLTTALIAVLETPPFLLPREHGNGVEDFWDAVRDALRTLRDVRAVAALDALVARVRSLTVDADREAEHNMYTQQPIGPYLQYQLERVADLLRASGAELAGAEAAHCEQLEARLTPERGALRSARKERLTDEQTRQRFLQTIASAPDDDAPRRAFADWLIARSDPQGEFIERQLEHAYDDRAGADQLAREAELIAAHGSRWLAELATVVSVTRYHRGFPAAVSVSFDDEARDEHVGHLGWATVERLVCHSFEWRDEEDHHVAVVGHPIMRSLRWLDTVTPAGLIALTREHTLPLTLLGVDLGSLESAQWPALLAALDRLPALEVLHVELGTDDGHAALTSLLAAPIAARLTRLVATPPDPRHPLAWIAAFPALEASALRRFDVQWGVCDEGLNTELPDGVRPRVDLGASFSRDAAGHLSVLRMTHVSDREYKMEELLALLWRLPADALTSFSLAQLPGLLQPSAPALAELRRTLRRFPRLTRIELPEPRDSDALVARLVGELASADAYVAARAVNALAPLRAPAARAGLSACLLGEAEAPRIPAAFALAEIADSQTIPALRAAVRRHDCRSALMAASILGELRATEAADELLELMERSPIDDAAQTALAALAMLGEPSTVPAIIARLKIELRRGVHARSSFPARRAALDALGLLAASGEAHDLVVQALQDGDLYDRRSAATALGLIGSPADHALLVAQLDHQDAPLRERAALASLVLAPAQVAVADAERVVGALDGWLDSESPTLVFATLMQRLAHHLALDDGAALARNPPAWTRLADSIARFAEDAINSKRAALVAGARRNPWQLPALKRSLELFEDLAPRWAAVRARLATRPPT